MPLSAERYGSILGKSFANAESALLRQEHPRAARQIEDGCDVVFTSQTQAYREVLLGCLLVRVTDRSKDIRLPYVKMGTTAFSGRSLDEKVVNPFLREKRIPCSRGPYLSVFRRQVRFDQSTREGLKDQSGYDALLGLLGEIGAQSDERELLSILDYVLYRFLLLREKSKVTLIKLDRLSLNQYKELTRALLSRRSGGFFPVTLVLAMIQTIVFRFSLPWEVSVQAMNVADTASGAGGDIMIREQGRDILTVEVTERPVDATRVEATFIDKIAPLSLPDYVFAVHSAQIGDEAREQAEKYFTQGYDVNFVDIYEWVTNALVTVGVKGRRHFQERVIQHLSDEEVPQALKVAWNEEVTRLTR